MADRKTSKGAEEKTADAEEAKPAKIEDLSEDAKQPPDEEEAPPAAEPEPDRPVHDPEAAAEETTKEIPQTDPVPPVSQPPAPVRRGGFAGMVLGGALAAVIGFGLSQYLGPQSWPFGQSADQTQALTRQVDSLKGSVADLGSKLSGISQAQQTADASASTAKQLSDQLKQLEGAVAALKEQATKEQSGVQQTLDGLEKRMSALEKLPVAPGGNADATVLQSLRAQLEAQRKQNASLAAEIKSVGEKANARIDSAEKQAQALKADAEAQAKAARARSALTRVQAALDLGGPYASSLDVLSAQGITVPDALSGPATKGVATQADLEQSFPPAARAGLEASIKATMEKSFTGRLSAFLRAQTGLRSLTPRKGNDPDAILSRAQADVKSGKVGEALQEISKLPEQGQKAMADWVSTAQTRLDALKAADDVAQSLGK